MFKNVLNKTSKSLIKKNSLKLNTFSTTNLKIDIYPDQVVNNLKSALAAKDEINWTDLEATILDNIHFFDADQFVDVVSLLAYADKGTEALWDVLSVKIFDYDLDLIQSYMLDEALQHTTKYDYFIDDQIARDALVWRQKWGNQAEFFKNKLL